MNNYLSLFLLLVVTSAQANVAKVDPKAPAVAAPAAAPVPAYKAYDYVGERFRDPFIPLVGDGRSLDEHSNTPPPIASMMLKGIVQDSRGRMALLVSGASSYVMRGGRLYDARNRMVKRISGVVKADSVVLIGSDRTVRELRTTPKF